MVVAAGHELKHNAAMSKLGNVVVVIPIRCQEHKLYQQNMHMQFTHICLNITMGWHLCITSLS